MDREKYHTGFNIGIVHELYNHINRPQYQVYPLHENMREASTKNMENIRIRSP